MRPASGPSPTHRLHGFGLRSDASGGAPAAEVNGHGAGLRKRHCEYGIPSAVRQVKRHRGSRAGRPPCDSIEPRWESTRKQSMRIQFAFGFRNARCRRLCDKATEHSPCPGPSYGVQGLVVPRAGGFLAEHSVPSTTGWGADGVVLEDGPKPLRPDGTTSEAANAMAQTTRCRRLPHLKSLTNGQFGFKEIRQPRTRSRCRTSRSKVESSRPRCACSYESRR